MAQIRQVTLALCSGQRIAHNRFILIILFSAVAELSNSERAEVVRNNCIINVLLQCLATTVQFLNKGHWSSIGVKRCTRTLAAIYVQYSTETKSSKYNVLMCKYIDVARHWQSRVGGSEVRPFKRSI